MKSIWPLLAAALFFWPLGAGAQGYKGVMAPQQGYHPPVSPPSSGGGLVSPYSGATGYASMMNNNNVAGTPGYARQDAMPDDDKPRHVSSPFVDSFAPKTKDYDDRGGVSIYDQVTDNSGTATERRRKAIIRKVEAEQKRAREDLKRTMDLHNREVQDFVKKTVRDSTRKAHGDGDTGDDDQQDDQSQADQSQTNDNTSPDAVKE